MLTAQKIKDGAVALTRTAYQNLTVQNAQQGAAFLKDSAITLRDLASQANTKIEELNIPHSAVVLMRQMIQMKFLCEPLSAGLNVNKSLLMCALLYADVYRQLVTHSQHLDKSALTARLLSFCNLMMCSSTTSPGFFRASFVLTVDRLLIEGTAIMQNQKLAKAQPQTLQKVQSSMLGKNNWANLGATKFLLLNTLTLSASVLSLSRGEWTWLVALPCFAAAVLGYSIQAGGYHHAAVQQRPGRFQEGLDLLAKTQALNAFVLAILALSSGAESNLGQVAAFVLLQGIANIYLDINYFTPEPTAATALNPVS